jgi:ABC-type molybdate transport system permease subunit
MDVAGYVISMLFVLYLVLLLAALVEWFRSPRTRYLSRWLWLPIILLFSIVGPLAFLLLGHGDDLLATTVREEDGSGAG